MTVQNNDTDMFICYAKKDGMEIKQLYDKLKNEGFRPFLDEIDIIPGELWEPALMKAVQRSPFFLACLSRNSVDRRGIIQKEIKQALEIWREKLEDDIYLIPVRLEECNVPNQLGKFQYVDLFLDDGFERLVKAIKIGLRQLGIICPVKLRSIPLVRLSESQVENIIIKNNFFDKNINWLGRGIFPDFELQHDGNVVFEKNTGLAWQKTGSKRNMSFEEAKTYVMSVNDSKFCGYNNWRLPTLEETLSLIEPRKYNNVFVNSVFDICQGFIWTADQKNDSRIWAVSHGFCIDYDKSSLGYIRAVR